MTHVFGLCPCIKQSQYMSAKKFSPYHANTTCTLCRGKHIRSKIEKNSVGQLELRHAERKFSQITHKTNKMIICILQKIFFEIYHIVFAFVFPLPAWPTSYCGS